MLAFAAADAKRVIGALARSPLHQQPNLTVLTNEEASLSAILDALDRIIAQADANDTIAVFFAAHGLVGATISCCSPCRRRCSGSPI